jgi:hypothetical protein
MKKLIVSFPNFANVPKNSLRVIRKTMAFISVKIIIAVKIVTPKTTVKFVSSKTEMNIMAKGMC